jgi:methylmalonyl-CoA/ethylmalonyl-CoA epimerase
VNNMNLDHVTIAVKDLEQSKQLFATMFNGKLIKEIEMPKQNARAAYYLLGNVIIGLEAPLSDDGEIYQFLQKKGEGIHHLAFSVDNLDDTQGQLQERIRTLGHSEKSGIRRELFTHPKSFMGLLVQLMEWQEPYKSSLKKRIDILGEA